MTGKLIFLVGLFGAGKTTLMNAAIEAIPNLHHLVSYVTRPPRVHEVSGKGEYIFVTLDEYFEKKAQSKKWDESIISDIYYGIDVEAVDRDLQEGKNLIICVAPDKTIIDQMSDMYVAKPILIWIDITMEKANTRVIKDGRPERVHHPMQTEERVGEIKKLVDVIYTTEEDIEKNKARFIATLQDILD